MPKTLLIILIGTGTILFFLLIGVAGGLWWISSNEYKPAARESVPVSHSLSLKPSRSKPIELYSWNIGYVSGPVTERNVEENIWAIQAFISAAAGDIVFFQEVDVNARRTYRVDQAAYFSETWKGSSAFAFYTKCPFIPVPFPHFIGKLESGLLTLNSYSSAAERISLPESSRWPERFSRFNCCLLVERMPVQDSDAELVLVNVYLDALDSNDGDYKARMESAAEFLKNEYANGNYCVAGGDLIKSGVTEAEFTNPDMDESSFFDAGWILAADFSVPGSRSPAISGFILSPNVELILVQTQDLEFRNSDHNPVKLSFSLR
jgi:exonuclease III